MPDTTVPQFPVRIEKKLTFEVNNQVDLDYFNNTAKDEDFIFDMKQMFEDMGLKLVEIDNVAV